jgi:hypothetical protein
LDIFLKRKEEAELLLFRSIADEHYSELSNETIKAVRFDENPAPCKVSD